MSSRALRALGAFLAVALVASLVGALVLPADLQAPVHFGPDGTPDRYGGRAEVLLACPALLAFFLGIGTWTRRRPELEASGTALDASLVSGGLLLVVLHGAILLLAGGVPVPLPALVRVGLSLLFIVIGNVMPKTRTNHLVGVRTPWTLRSAHSWRRTHVLASRLFVGLGLVLLVLALAWPARFAAGLLAGLPVVVVALFVASWHFARHEPSAP